jgi:hypothetical protein
VLEIVNDWCSVCDSLKPVECVLINDKPVCVECIHDAAVDLDLLAPDPVVVPVG